MAKPTWNIAIDLDGNDDFTDANEDVTSYAEQASWRLGFSEPFESIARPENLTLTLNNEDKRFSPEFTTGILYPDFTIGKAIRIQSTYSGSTFTHFLGWIDGIRPAPGKYRDKRTEIECRGFLELAQNTGVLAAASQNVTADVAVTSLINTASILPSFFSINAETGQSTLDVIGDGWNKDTTVYGALADVVGQEIGRLFVSRSGSVVFWNRTHFIEDTVTDASFNDTLVNLDYRYGEDIVNSVIIQANTKTVGASNVTLGQIDQSLKIRANSYLSVAINYTDQSTGLAIGGTSLVTPAASTDYTANSNSDGTGTDYTGSVTACLVTAAGGKAELEFTNSAVTDVWLQSGAKIRGLKVTDYGQTEIKKEDATSITNYMRRPYSYPYTLDDVALAESAANYILSRSKDPLGIVESGTIKPYTNATLLEQGLRRTIGDRISIQETQTGMDKEFFIIGEQFDMMPGDLTVAWYLEQADSNQYWILGTVGFSELEVTTLLGPY